MNALAPARTGRRSQPLSMHDGDLKNISMQMHDEPLLEVIRKLTYT
jgi:hypothetical protein